MNKLLDFHFRKSHMPSVKLTFSLMGCLLTTCILLIATPTVGILFNDLTFAKVVPNRIRENARVRHWHAYLEVEGPTDFVQQHVSVAAGGSSGWHSHPGPVLITIKSGTATWYNADDPECKAKSYPAGSAFVEPANTPHFVGNDGQSDLELMNTYVIPHGVPTRQDQPKPNNCPF